MDIFIKTYLKILGEATLTSFSELNPKDFAKSNGNFPEGSNINITSDLNLPKFIKVILPKHCIKSESKNEIHGFNYLEISKNQSINCISKALNQLFIEFPINKLLQMNYGDFAIICIHKTTNIHYRFSFKTKSNGNKIIIYLKSIFKSDKKPNYTGNKYGYFRQYFLKDIIFEKSIHQPFELKTIYF